MNVDYIKAKAEQAGNHFFDEDAMRFWNSIVLPSSFVKMDEEVYRFVTSEKNWGCARRYTIREADMRNGRFVINTIGNFQQYATGREAKKNTKEN